MRAVIISDVHLGSPQCRVEAFIRFLEALPPEPVLILNGDTVGHGFRVEEAPAAHVDALRRLEDESARRRVLWIRGNNDRTPERLVGGAIECLDAYTLGHRLHIEHGDRFDRLMPRIWPLLYLIRRLYDRACRLTGRQAHITETAARFQCLYRVLTRHMARNAARYARSQGIAAVTCGHSHYPEDRMVDTVRYLNTGSWMGSRAHAVLVSGDCIRLHNCDSVIPAQVMHK